MITPCIVTTYHANPIQYYCKSNIKMTTNFWCFNNLLEMVATPQQCLGNASVTNIPKPSKDKLQRFFTTTIAPEGKNSKTIVNVPTGVEIDHTQRGIKARASKPSFHCSTPKSEKRLLTFEVLLLKLRISFHFCIFFILHFSTSQIFDKYYFNKYDCRKRQGPSLQATTEEGKCLTTNKDKRKKPTLFVLSCPISTTDQINNVLSANLIDIFLSFL